MSTYAKTMGESLKRPATWLNILAAMTIANPDVAYRVHDLLSAVAGVAAVLGQ
ncbi:hypothetical protein [Chitiniphilus eburneus]|uniref:hypothetical protein n=1 Tax=Chitiniphilus eburneus TaxID=2571148 RepID=UPI0035CF27ED